MKKWIHISLLIVQSVVVFGQRDTLRVVSPPDTLIPGISMIGAYHGGKNHLRWAPNTASLWYAMSAKGYYIDRYQMSGNNFPDTMSRKRVEVKPWRIEQFRPYLEGSEKNVLAAGQCLYGSWESAGGANANVFSRADEAENRYSIAMLVADLDSLASRSLGLSWIDETVEKGKKYVYQLRPASDSLASLYSYALSIDTRGEYLPPLTIDSIEENEKAVVLYWEKYENAAFYTAYWVERKGPGENYYSRLSEDPIVPASSKDFESFVVSYKDSVENYTPFSYRIIGITPFGYASDPSPSVIAMGRDRTPTSAVSDFVFAEENATIVLNWKSPPEADLHHFEVFRSLKFDGPYQRIDSLPKSQNQYRDISPDILKSPYYLIAAVDTADNKSLSIKLRGFLRDTIAPEPPTGLKGSIDSFGIVRLTWDANMEEDLDGYYVYYANQIDHQFTNLTGYPIRSNGFIDTVSLKTLTEHVYYKVTAADQFNHISKFSEAVEIKRPDTIPPSPAQIVNYQLEENAVVFNIARSKSKDVAVQEMLRRDIPDGQWQKLGDLNADTYTDKGVAYGQTYEYRILTMDDDGNTAYDKAPLVITIMDKTKAQKAEITSIKADSLSKSITISWENHPQSIQVIIYRSINGSPFVTLAKSKNMGQYEDKDNIMPGRSYGYKIKQVMKDGKISTLSEALSVNLKSKE